MKYSISRFNLRRQSAVFLLLGLLPLSSCQTGSRPSVSLQPPVAPQHPKVTEIHGDRLIDNYFWLRNKQDPAVLDYLKAEDAYTDAMMKPTQALQERLYNEMLKRIQETDRSVPYGKGEWLYYQRNETGKQYLVYCRRHGNLAAPEEIVVDENQLAAGQDFLDLGMLNVSNDGNFAAYTVDTEGSRDYTLYIKDLRTGKLLPETRQHVDTAAWAADNTTLFYLTEDAAKRSYQLWRHVLKAPTDTLIYEEKDELFALSLGESRNREYLVFSASSKTSSECHYLRADHPADEFKLFLPRAKNIEYDMDQAADNFYIRINDKGRNFRLVTAPINDPRPENWQEIIPTRDDVMLDDIEMFAHYFLVLERENGLPQMRVVETATGHSQRIQFPDAVYSFEAEENPEFNTNVFRYGYDSLRTPHSTYDCDLTTGQTKLLKTQTVKEYNPANYQVERLFAPASDGVLIPISLVYRKDRKTGGPQPLLLDGYGAYGMSEDVWFSPNRVSLLDRGVIFAIAHVRGGGEFGKKWHEAGRMMNKRNTFTDFIAAADYLSAQKITAPGQLAINGGSAGGLLMGAVLNLRPDLCKVALVEVPFVDVINTMLDETLPLTVTEFEEWGNPKLKPDYDYIRSYSPYDNIARTNYPVMMVKTSLNDSQVMYWEPVKYVAKLRTMKTDHNLLLLKVDLGAAGHSGKSGRYDALRDEAFNFAFLLWQWGIKE